MRIKLVASDLDGTLLGEDFRVPQDVQEMVGKMVERGVAVAIATGRMHRAAVDAAKTLHIDIPIISYNGAMVKRAVSGELLRHVTMPPVKAKAILDLAKREHYKLQMYVNDELYVTEMTDLTEWYQKATGVKALIEPDLAKIIDRSGEPTKILVSAEAPQLKSFAKEARTLVGNSLYITKSHEKFLEFLAAEAGKGAGVAMIAQKLGIKKEETLCIGDNLNDLSLFEAGAVKVAMGNAAAELKKAATWITADREAGGWCAAMRKYVL